MKRVLPLISLTCLSLLITACQNTLKSDRGLYNVELQRNIKVPVDGYWTWGKGNPYEAQKSGRIYIHPLDVSLIMQDEPEAAPLMAIQMQDYMTHALVATLRESNSANDTDWKLTANPAEADVCIHTAVVKFRKMRPVINTINTVAGSFIDVPGASQFIGIIGAGNITLECTMRDARTGQLLMAFKDSNRKAVRLYNKEAYSYTGNADVNLKAWAADIAKVIRASAQDRLQHSTLQQKLEEKSYRDVFSQRVYEQVPTTEEINAWEALD